MKKNIIVCAALFCGLLLFSCAHNGSVSENADPLDKKEFALSNMFEGCDIDIGFDGGRLYGFSGVNRYMGSYDIDGGKIKLGGMGVTMMAGPEDKMEAESAYLKLLSEVSAFSFDGETLIFGELIFKLK